METQDLILKGLFAGKTQAEISQKLKDCGVKPNSLSHVEKLLKALRKEHNATTMFHLGVILTKKKHEKIL